MDLERALSIAKQLAIEQGEKLSIVLKNIIVTEKKDPEGIDLATSLDGEIEKTLVEELGNAFPQAGFQVEEQQNLQKNEEYQWVIDPIDGTKYFASRVPLFSISIGLVRNGDPILGVIYNPVSRQLYSGSLCSPAECNGEKVRILNTKDLAHTMVSVDYPQHSEQAGGTSWAIGEIDLLLRRVYRVRMLGSAALSLAWVASGSVISAFVTLAGSVKFVDVAAGLAICKAGGAKVLSFENSANKKMDYIVGSDHIVQEIKEILLS